MPLKKEWVIVGGCGVSFLGTTKIVSVISLLIIIPAVFLKAPSVVKFFDTIYNTSK